MDPLEINRQRLLWISGMRQRSQNCNSPVAKQFSTLIKCRKISWFLEFNAIVTPSSPWGCLSWDVHDKFLCHVLFVVIFYASTRVQRDDRWSFPNDVKKRNVSDKSGETLHQSNKTCNKRSISAIAFYVCIIIMHVNYNKSTMLFSPTGMLVIASSVRRPPRGVCFAINGYRVRL